MNLYNAMLNKMMLAADALETARNIVPKTLKPSKDVRDAYQKARDLEAEATREFESLPRYKEIANADSIEIITDTCKNHGVALFMAVDTPDEYESRYICMICLYNLLHDLFNAEEAK